LGEGLRILVEKLRKKLTRRNLNYILEGEVEIRRN